MPGLKIMITGNFINKACKTNQGTPTTPAPCSTPQCKNIPCTKDAEHFKNLSDGRTAYLRGKDCNQYILIYFKTSILDPKSLGTWFDYNERTYLYIQKKLSVSADSNIHFFGNLNLLVKIAVGGCIKRVLWCWNETVEH
jgi:hypothetical protein